MLESKYVILTIPKSEKSMVLRIIENDTEGVFSIGNLRMNASLISINDSVSESLEVAKNLS